MVFVNKGGSDVSGNGSPDKPYLTISHALAQINDASASKIYSLFVGPGNYAENVILKAFVHLHGCGKETLISPPGGNFKYISANFYEALVTDIALSNNCFIRRDSGDSYEYALIFSNCYFANVVSLPPSNLESKHVFLRCRAIAFDIGFYKNELYFCTGNLNLTGDGVTSNVLIHGHNGNTLTVVSNYSITHTVKLVASQFNTCSLNVIGGSSNIIFTYAVGSLPDGQPTIAGGTPTVNKLNTAF